MLGESGYARNAADAYWTPAWCVDVLLRHVTWLDSSTYPVWEPACGTGNICEVLAKHKINAIATDLHDYGYEFGNRYKKDFLKDPELITPYSAIITNPPYNLGDEFVIRACALMKPRQGMVAMLLRNEWDSAASRTPILRSLTTKLVLTKRPRWSADNKASPRHNFAWFIWDFSQNTYPRILWDQ